MRVTAQCSQCGHSRTANTPPGVYRIQAHCSQCGHAGVIALKAFDAEFYKSFADAWLKLHAKAESQLAEDLMPVFRQQAEDVAANLESNYGDKDGEQLAKSTTAGAMAKAIFDPAKWTDDIKEAAAKSLAKTAAAGALHELASFGGGTKKASVGLDFDFGVDLPADMLDAIEAELKATMAEDYWGGIAETQLNDLGGALQKGIDEGLSARQIASDMQDVFGGTMGRDRANRIARTESTGAMGAGGQAARVKLQAEGIIRGKEWISTFDALTRETHLAAYGQERRVDQDFSIGGHPAMYPGDRKLPAGERCNCRCAATSIADMSDKAFLLSIAKACEAHRCGGNGWPYRRAP